MHSKGLLLGRGALEQGPHLVKWMMVFLIRRDGFWGLRIFPFSIRPSFANEICVSLMKEKLFGIK